MRTYAHAKVNLLLSVRPGAQPDGYHAVETVMCPLELADEVTVRETAARGIELACEPDPLAGESPERNLAYRAAQDLARALGRDAALSIKIAKHIPAQAGLGGGSSDAGAVLRCLGRLWGLDPYDPVLVQVASGLGADVAFFLHEVPTRLVGHGDVAVEHFVPFSAPLVLVKPPVGVSTAAAYRELDRLRPAELATGDLAAALRAGDVGGLAGLCGNNMQTAACSQAPEVGDVIAFLGGLDALVGAPLLCGSGSCVAAFVRSDVDAEQAACAARTHGWWTCATRTLA